MANILIIDDDPMVLSLFEQFLTTSGYSVTTAEDGIKGLRQIDQLRPDLVITDIMMPEMDGLELLMKISKHHSGTPVIAISGGMKTHPVNFLPQAKQFGARCILEKPVALAELLKAVRELLGEPA